MTETQFWNLLEEAWNEAGGLSAQRASLARPSASEEALEEVSIALEEMIPALAARLEQIDKQELLSFDRILERKLYDIDREEIQQHTDGSDDGFLYARGFIVAMGQSYYESISGTPSLATMDAECEDICYLSHHIYEDRFGEMPESDISRESASNPEGWPED